jgi:hypothetical protein
VENLETLAEALSRTLFQLAVPYDAIRIDAEDGVVVINGVPAQAPREGLDHAFAQARLHAEIRPAGLDLQIRVHAERD